MAENQNIKITITGRDNASGKVDRVSKSMRNMDASSKSLQSGIIRLVGAVASLAAAVAAISFPIRESIEFEKAMTEVAKTTGFGANSIKVLSASLRELSKETGVAAVDLALIAARAGQLGLGRQGQQAIAAFTDSISRFAVVADLSVDQAAMSIAKITNLFQIPIDQAEKVSAVFNELSNTTVATAENLVDVVRRVGSAGGLLEFAEAAALAAQALELGQTPEVAGTALIKTFANAAIKAEQFAATVGITTEEWTKKLKTSGLDAIREVATAIAELDTLAQGEAIKNLFGGGRQFAFGQRIVEDAANGFKVLNRTIRDSENAYILGTSSLLEYERITQSTSRQIAIMWQNFKDLAITVGDIFLPAINRAVTALKEFAQDPKTVKRLKEFAEDVLSMADALGKVFYVVGLLLPDIEILLKLLGAIIAIGILSWIGKLIFGVGAMSLGMKKATSTALLQVGVVGKLTLAYNALTGAMARTAVASRAATVSGAIAATVAVRSGGLIATAFRGIGALFTAALGPAGIPIAIALGVAGLLASFSTDFRTWLKGLLGIIDEEVEDTVAKMEDKAKKRIEALAAFNEAASSETGEVTLVAQEIDFTAVGKNVEGFSGQIAAATANITKFAEAITGADVKTKALKEQWVNVGRSILDAKADISLLTTEQEQLVDLVSRIDANQNPITRSMDDDLRAEAVARIKEIEAAYVELRETVRSLQGVETIIAEQRVNTVFAKERLIVEQNKQALEITKFLTQKEAIDLGRYLQLRRAEAQIGKAKAEISRLTVEKGVENLEIIDLVNLRKAGGDVVRLKAEIEELEGLVGKTGDNFDVFGNKVESAAQKVVQKIGGEAFNKLVGMEQKALAPLIQGFKDIDDVLVFKNVKDATNQLRRVVIEKALIDAQINDFQRLEDGVVSVAKAIKGVYDNLAASQRAALIGVQQIVDSIKLNLQERRISIGIEFALQENEEKSKKNIKQIENKVANSIKRIQSTSISQPVKDAMIATLERRMEKTREFHKQQLKERNIAAEFIGLQQARAAALNVLIGKEREAAELKKQLDTATGASKEEIEARKQLTEEYVVLNKQLTTASDNYIKAATAKLMFNKSIRLLDSTSATEFSQNFLQSEQQINVEAEALVVRKKETLLIQRELTDSAFESSEANATAAEKLNDFAAVSARLGTQIEQIATNLGVGAIELTTMAIQAERVRDALRELSFFELGAEEFDRQLDLLKQRIAPTVKGEIEAGIVGVSTTLDLKLENAVVLKEDYIKALNEGNTAIADDLQTKLMRMGDSLTLEIKTVLKTEIDGVTTYSDTRTPGFNAKGGLIRGRGTGTSDSILSFVSNGEYIMDAKTTNLFGPAFFRALQSFAKSGMGIPKFASGGPIFAGGVDLPTFSSGEGNRDIVDINLNLPNGVARLHGDRQEVDKLTTAFRALSRGMSR